MFLSPNPAQANDTGEEGNTSAANLDVMSIDNMIPQPVSARNSTPNQSASFNIENETPDPRLSFNLSGLNRSNIRPHHQTPNVFFGERPTPITATSAMSSAPNCQYNRQESSSVTSATTIRHTANATAQDSAFPQWSPDAWRSPYVPTAAQPAQQPISPDRGQRTMELVNTLPPEMQEVIHDQMQNIIEEFIRVQVHGVQSPAAAQTSLMEARLRPQPINKIEMPRITSKNTEELPRKQFEDSRRDHRIPERTHYVRSVERNVKGFIDWLGRNTRRE